MKLTEKEFEELKKTSRKNGWSLSTDDLGEGNITYNFSKTHGIFTSILFATKTGTEKHYEIFDEYYNEITN